MKTSKRKLEVSATLSFEKTDKDFCGATGSPWKKGGRVCATFNAASVILGTD